MSSALMILTAAQQIILLEIYLELEINEKSDLELNLLLANAGTLFSIPKSKKKDNKEFQRQQLMSFIFANMTGSEFSNLLQNNVYTNLDKKYNFDTTTTNRTWFCESLKAIISHFHQSELARTKKLALKDSLKFCLFIVTIPFIKLYYDLQKSHYENDNFFKTRFVDASYFSLRSKNKKISPYGLIAKQMSNADKRPFQEQIFSSSNPEKAYRQKRNIRKLIISEKPIKGRPGLTLLGTRDQVFYGFGDVKDPFLKAKQELLDTQGEQIKISMWRNRSHMNLQEQNAALDLINQCETNLNVAADIINQSPALLEEHLPKEISKLIIDYAEENIDSDILREKRNQATLKKILNDINAKKYWHTGIFGLRGDKRPSSISEFARMQYVGVSFFSCTYSVCKSKILIEKSLSRYSFTRSKETKAFYKNMLAELEQSEPTIKSLRI